MENIRLDKNYNFVDDKSLYEDHFIDALDLISKAQSSKLITEAEANFLFKIALKKEFKNEAKTIIPSTKQATEVHSFFMNMKSKQIKHA